MNPLDMPGPDFLRFFVTWGIGIVGGGWLLKKALAGLIPGQPARRWVPRRYPREDEVYHVALLRGGRAEAIRVMLVKFLGGELIRLENDEVRDGSKSGTAGRLPPLEKEVFGAIRYWDRAAEVVKSVTAAAASRLAQIESELEREGLLRTREEIAPFHVLSAFILLAVPGLGIVKVMKALSEGRTNVGFLIILLVIFAIVIVWALRPPRFTKAGAAYLEWLRSAHDGLLETVKRGRTVSDGELALAASVYGLSALGTMGPAAPLHRSLRKGSIDTGTDLSHASGGGDSSGGGGCGGGGCGGGGCGGCGG